MPHKLTDANRLSIQNPKLAQEWHPTKNGKHTPDMYSTGSKFKPYWLCSEKDCQYVWQATIKDRKVNGCPKCKVPGPLLAYLLQRVSRSQCPDRYTQYYGPGHLYTLTQLRQRLDTAWESHRPCHTRRTN